MSKDNRVSVGTCYVCKREWFRDETTQWVYHESVGVVCIHHHGIKTWYNELIKNLEVNLSKYYALDVKNE